MCAQLVGIAKGDGSVGVLIGLYEAEDSKDGVLFKRVCDFPVTELIRHQTLSSAGADWPSTYEPVNRYGGNRKLPSRASAAALTVA